MMNDDSPIARFSDAMGIAELIPFGELGPVVDHFVFVGIFSGDEILSISFVRGMDKEGFGESGGGSGGGEAFHKRAAGRVHGSPRNGGW